MLFVFEFFIWLMVFIQYKIYKKLITPFSIMALPYSVLVPINNYWAVTIGFYAIQDNVMKLVLAGLGLFFIGTIIGNNRRRIISRRYALASEGNTEELQLYRINAMKRYVLFVVIIALGRALYIVATKGISFFTADANEGYMLTGIVGHLLLTLYPLIPILLYYWLKNKKDISVLVICLLALSCFFLSFVKYHLIALLVLIYLFVVFKDRNYLKIGTILVVAIPITVFLGNYFITFFIRGVVEEVGNAFYKLHLWKYLAGSLIHDAVIFSTGVNVHWSAGYKIGRLLCALPNMFLYPILGYKPLFTSIDSDLGMSAVGDIAEKGNTVDFFGYLYPSQGGILNFIMFVVVIVVLGIFITKLYNRACDNLDNYSLLTFALSVIVFCCFFSFFGVYTGLSTTWEIFVWSLIMPYLFYKKSRIRFGRR